MTRDWNVGKIVGDIQRIAWKGNDPRITGWEAYPCKQDLYKIKWALEAALASMPTFSGEDAWLEEQRVEREKQQVWKVLNETNPK